MVFSNVAYLIVKELNCLFRFFQLLTLLIDLKIFLVFDIQPVFHMPGMIFEDYW